MLDGFMLMCLPTREARLRKPESVEVGFHQDPDHRE